MEKKMKRKMAESIKNGILEIARKSVGKSFKIGVYEVKIPRELLEEIREQSK